MPSPRPVPIPVKRLRGNPGQRRLPEVPEPPQWEGACPDWLEDPLAREFWADHARMFLDLGLLTAADERAFGAVCGAWARFRHAYKALDTGRTAGEQRKREVGYHTAVMRYFRLAQEWGMTPASRVRLGTPKVNKPVKDRWATRAG